MKDSVSFPYVHARAGVDTSLMPILPVELSLGSTVLQVGALLDTGAAVNVLPYPLGVQLGANWDEQRVALQLTGSLGHWPAKALLLTASLGCLGSVAMAFAWTKAESAPLLLGQVNFFSSFDVCFFRAERRFELRRR
ncbi:MAG: retroviral-like aspartic protease [Myxococcota bacterium]|nr:retroviral-like aspartic protease [Myxococcota bacterium]